MTTRATDAETVIPEQQDVPRKRSVWTVPAYIVWLVSDTATGLGSTLYSFALPLLVLVATNDPVSAGVLAAVSRVVSLVATFVGGVLADRRSRVRLMVVGACCGVIISAALLLLAISDNLVYAALFAISLLLALRSGLFETATEASLKDVVPPDLMGGAQAANQGRNALLSLLGGPLGGALLAVGSWLIALVMFVSNAVAGVCAAWVGKLAPDATKTAADRKVTPSNSVLKDGMEGIRWVFGRRDLRGPILIATIINLGLNTSVTTTIYSMQQGGFSSVEIGMISAAIGLVMVVGSLFGPRLVATASTGRIMVIGLISLTMGQIAVVFFHSLVGIMASLAASVLLMPALNASLMGYFMVATPTEFVGRANSASVMLALGALPLAPLIAGIGLAQLGRDWTLVIGAALSFVACLMAWLDKAVRKIPKASGWELYASHF